MEKQNGFYWVKRYCNEIEIAWCDSARKSYLFTGSPYAYPEDHPEIEFIGACISPNKPSQSQRPAIGLTPRFIHDTIRHNEILDAIVRQCKERVSNTDYKPINLDWIDELVGIQLREEKRKK